MALPCSMGMGSMGTGVSSSLLGKAKPGELPSNVQKNVLFGGTGPLGPWPPGSKV